MLIKGPKNRWWTFGYVTDSRGTLEDQSQVTSIIKHPTTLWNSIVLLLPTLLVLVNLVIFKLNNIHERTTSQISLYKRLFGRSLCSPSPFEGFFFFWYFCVQPELMKKQNQIKTCKNAFEGACYLEMKICYRGLSPLGGWEGMGLTMQGTKTVALGTFPFPLLRRIKR